ncbi:endonuclease/exonuclease/phosphatase family protein [Candidatus Microgenomates bacterium]|nr:endonuclease/exonuclease/phosphatase family protein [Candidatus Microgenomates bacterium]
MITIMSYNILEGGEGRIDEILAIVRDVKPDILCLQEVNGWDLDDWKQLKLFAFKAGFKHYELGIGKNSDYHVVTMSKTPIVFHQTFEGVQNPGLHIVTDTSYGELSICNVHLSPYEEHYRVDEVEKILKSQLKYKNSMIFGDLNSLSFHDGYRNELVSDFNMSQLKKFTKNGKLAFDVIMKIEGQQYKDVAVLQKKNDIKTVPTVTSRDKAHSTPLRLDYAFVSQALASRIHSYEVLKNDKTENTSDHYPIVVKMII